MAKVLNLFAGPGTGKSTTAAGLFYLLKTKGLKVELVQEYAKDVVWDENYSKLKDQFYITANQNRRIKRLENHGLDFIIVDSPVIQSLVYKSQNYYPSFDYLVKEIHDSYDNINIFLSRTKQYMQYGRSQSEEEAKHLDQKIKDMLIEYNIEYEEILGDKDAPENIVKLLEKLDLL